MSTARIQTYRSAVAGNRPTSGDPGQLYVNWPERMLGVLDASGAAMDLLALRPFSTLSPYLAGQFVTNAGDIWMARTDLAAGAFSATNWLSITNLAKIGVSAPAPADNGALWLDTTVPATPSLKVYVTAAAAWRTVGADRLSLAGGSMTGQIVQPAAPTLGTHLTNKTYVDAQNALRITQAQADLRYLKLTGGAISGTLGAAILEINDLGIRLRMTMNSVQSRLYMFGVNPDNTLFDALLYIGIAAPTQPGDATNKAYVDLMLAQRLTEDQGDVRYPLKADLNAFLRLTGGTLSGDLYLPSLHVNGRVNFADNAYMYQPSTFSVVNVSLAVNNVVSFQFFLNGQTPNASAVLTKGPADALYFTRAEATATWVMQQVAGVGVGTVGSYALAYRTDNTSSIWGDNVAGSALTVAGVAQTTAGQVTTGSAVVLAGNWQAHGHSSLGGSTKQATLFKRRV